VLVCGDDLGREIRHGSTFLSRSML
jgi:hypothetical protein